MGATIVDIDKELKMKISRIMFLESRLLCFCSFISISMTVIFLTKYNTRFFDVAFQKNGCIRVQKFKDLSDYENKIFYVKPLKIMLGKSEVCEMTCMSGAFDQSVFDGNNILPKITEENDKHRYVYVDGDMICSSLTNDNVYKYI